MSDIKFSLLHPTARPAKFMAVADAWAASADNPTQVEYVLVPERNRGFGLLNGLLPFVHSVIVWNTGRPCLVDGFNLAAKSSRGDVLVIIADDFFPAPHWDTDLLNVLGSKINEEAVVWASTNGPNDANFIVHPILTRKYYERYGYVFYPEYESAYADNELNDVAIRDGVIIDARKVLKFDHRHWSYRPSVVCDDVYQKQEARVGWSAELFTRRRLAGFPR